MHINGRIKKIAAVHDLSGVGRVSLTAVIPILSSMGFQVCPLPTAVLSNHTQYPDYSLLDLTEEMQRIVEKWKKMDVHFDTFYSGYLASARQIKIVEDLITYFRRPSDLVVVDPVMGDNGKLYVGMGLDMVEEMKEFIRYADVITPNLTEMFLLLGAQEIPDVLTDQVLKAGLKSLSDKGPEIVIVTSVPVADNPHLTSVYAYNRAGGRFW